MTRKKLRAHWTLADIGNESIAENLIKSRDFNSAADFLLEWHNRRPQPGSHTRKLLFALRANNETITAHHVANTLLENYPDDPFVKEAIDEHKRYSDFSSNTKRRPGKGVITIRTNAPNTPSEG